MGKVERATDWRVQIDACDTRADEVASNGGDGRGWRGGREHMMGRATL